MNRRLARSPPRCAAGWLRPLSEAEPCASYACELVVLVLARQLIPPSNKSSQDVRLSSAQNKR
jgi:hypothetical protein